MSRKELYSPACVVAFENDDPALMPFVRENCLSALLSISFASLLGTSSPRGLLVQGSFATCQSIFFLLAFDLALEVHCVISFWDYHCTS